MWYVIITYNLILPPVNRIIIGHATLATSHTLLNELKLPFTELIFHTLSGQLTVTKKGDLLQMNFPVGNPLPVTLPPQAIAQLARAFGFEQTSIVDTAYCSTTRKLVVELKSLQEVLKCAVPAATDLMSIDFADIDVRGVIIVTTNLEGAAEKFKDCDFASRYFAPWVAIPEDPVCGMHSPTFSSLFLQTYPLLYFIKRFCTYCAGRLLPEEVRQIHI